MADCNVCKISSGTAAELELDAVAAAFTVPRDGNDSKLALVVNNANTNTPVRVKIKAGDGVRSVIGDYDVDIDAEEIVAIPLFDSARFGVFADGDIDVQIKTTADGALTASALSSVLLSAIQL